MMIDYIKKTANGLLETHVNNQMTIVDQAITGYLNHLAHISLRNLDTILKLTRKILKCTQKVPIYINKELLLIQYGSLRSSSALLINYRSIAHISVEKNNVGMIYFKSGTILKINNHKQLINQIELIKKLIDYLDLNMLK